MNTLKVLYLTVPSFFDLEISLIRELKKLIDIKVVMIVSPESMHSSAFSIDELDKRCEIISATEYHGMEKYCDILNLEDWYIANNPDNSFVHGISLAYKINQFYKQYGFSILHSTTDCKTAIMFIPYAWNMKNTIFTTHDPIPHSTSSFVRELIMHKLLYKVMKNHLFLSDCHLDVFCEKYNVSKDRIFFSRLSIYDFLKNYKTCFNKYGNYILYFGRIMPYKGVDVLIDAYMDSIVRKKGYKLIIAGKGQINHNKKQLGNDIIFLNRYIENEELANLIRYCSFVVLPYISATQSGCVMSAFAFNKPIIATRVGDMQKVIIDGETGFICNPNDKVDLCSKLDLLLSSELSAFENKINSKYSEGGMYSWTAAAKMVVDAYIKISRE